MKPKWLLKTAWEQGEVCAKVNAGTGGGVRELLSRGIYVFAVPVTLVVCFCVYWL